MRRNVILPALALTLFLALSGREARSQAIVYDYSFGGNATGQFTTNTAAIDPGYFLVTDLTILTFNDVNSGPQTFSNVHVILFSPGAAYNPTTGAFINHASGSTFHDIGQLILGGTISGGSAQSASGNSFKLGSTEFRVNAVNNGLVQLRATGPLTVTLAAVPEPSFPMLFGIALAATRLGVFARRRDGRPERGVASARDHEHGTRLEV